MKKATFIKSRRGQGDGRVYRLDPPMISEYEPELNPIEYVWVSAANVIYSGPETYIFACDENGEVRDWGELEGSFKGSLDHTLALNNAGYVLEEEE